MRLGASEYSLLFTTATDARLAACSAIPEPGTALGFFGAGDERTLDRPIRWTRSTLLRSAEPRLPLAPWLSGGTDVPQAPAVPSLRPRQKKWTAIVAGKGDGRRLPPGSQAHRRFYRPRIECPKR